MSVWILILEMPTFLRTSLLGLLSLNGNDLGICIRTYVYLSMYKINFGSCVRTEPFATVQKLEYGPPTTSFSFVKKWRANLVAIGYIYVFRIVHTYIVMCYYFYSWFCIPYVFRFVVLLLFFYLSRKMFYKIMFCTYVSYYLFSFSSISFARLKNKNILVMCTYV